MNSNDLYDMLAEARVIFARDPERAYELRKHVAETEISPVWSEAQTDLASQAQGDGKYQKAADHAMVVLRAPAERVSPAARAIAGIIWNDAAEVIEQPVDEELLKDSIEHCVSTGHPYYAAAGLAQMGRILLTRGDRAAAIRAYERAAPLFDQAGSMTAGPSVLLKLAMIDIEDGRREDARARLEQGLRHLRQFPYAGRSARTLEAKLTTLLASLDAE